MKVFVNKLDDVSSDLGLSGLRFEFELDRNDSTESVSTNAGGGKIQLMSNYCNFYFPFDVSVPHPDLCAFTAIKIISPYVGKVFDMGNGVSHEMAEAIKKEYPRIKKVKVDPSVSPVAKKKRNGVAISFSGGVDSIAAASLIDKSATLVMTARTYHPEVGEFEKWNNPRAQIKTLRYMPYDYKKVLVYTDFPYLSTNGKFCLYPDTYSFTIPIVLLSDSHDFGCIVTGDILAAFTANETVYSNNLESRAKSFFDDIGIFLEYPCNGITEIITTKIAKEKGLLEISSACEYGDFKKPCMKCLKCFRKSVYRWALFDEPLSKDELKRFDNSPAIIKFANGSERLSYNFMPSFKYCFSSICYEFEGNIKIIKDRAMSYSEPFNWVDRRFSPAYENRSLVVAQASKSMRGYVADMNSWDIDGFRRMNWKVNYGL